MTRPKGQFTSIEQFEQVRREVVQWYRQSLQAMPEPVDMAPRVLERQDRGDYIREKIEYTVEAGATNPFLHMGLHLGIREQVATGRPAGIETIHAELAIRMGDAHAAEHRMIDCLAETLWEAQSCNQAPDEAAYLERLRRL